MRDIRNTTAVLLAIMLAGAALFLPVQAALADAPDDEAAPAAAGEDGEDAADVGWLPHLHLGAAVTDDRQVGVVDYMCPLWQSPDAMFFADIRTRFADGGSIEGNFGLGFHRIVPGAEGESNGWIWGVYGFYDGLHSEHGNWFNQATLGAELLRTNFELRGNVYIPDGNSHIVGRNTAGSVTLSGTTVMEHTISLVARERALPGCDAEIGYGFDMGEKDMLWIHAGYFYFDHSRASKVAGPRLRLAYEHNDAFGIPGGTLLAGVNVQDDDTRDTDVFGTVSLSIPIGSRQSRERRGATGRGIAGRMTRPVVRDIDIVTSCDDMRKAPGSTGGPQIAHNNTAPLTDPATGGQVDVLFVDADGSAAGAGTEDEPMTIAEAESASGPSDVIVLSNDAGDIDVSGASGGTLTLKACQQLVGVGDGAAREVWLPGDYALTIGSVSGRPTLTRAAGASVVTLLWENTLEGLAVSGGNAGIYGANGNSPAIRDVTIENVGSIGLYLANSSGVVSVSNSRIRNCGTYGVYLPNAAGGSVEVSLSGNEISDNGAAGVYCTNTTAGTITAEFVDNTMSGNVYRGIDIYNATGATAAIAATGNTMSANGDEGLRIRNATGGDMTATIEGNTIAASGDDNIYVENSAGTMNLTLDGNDITGSTTDAGVRIYNLLPGAVLSAIASGNRCADNNDQGFLLYNTGDAFTITLQGNTVTGNGVGGLDYDTDSGATVLTIDGNTIVGNGGIGIAVDQDTDPAAVLSLTLTNNLVDSSSSTGVYLDNSAAAFNALVEDNFITGNISNGLYLVSRTGGALAAGIHRNTIIENGARGVHLYNVDGVLEAALAHNTIAMNANDGLELDDLSGGAFIYDLGGGMLGSVGLNSIFANGSGVDVDNDTGVTITARHNWWGVFPPNPARFQGLVDYDPPLASTPN